MQPQPVQPQQPQQPQSPQQGQMVGSPAPGRSATCGESCNALTCGKPVYRVLTTLWIIFIVLGIIFVAVDPSEPECPKGCVEDNGPCLNYDCICISEGVCRDKVRKLTPLGATGSALLSIGVFALLVVACFACCCYTPPPMVVMAQPVFVQYPNGQVYAQPAYGQPAYGQPAYGQPAYGQPAYGQPAYGQPVYGQPQAAPGTYAAGVGTNEGQPNIYPQSPAYGAPNPNPAGSPEGKGYPGNFVAHS